MALSHMINADVQNSSAFSSQYWFKSLPGIDGSVYSILSKLSWPHYIVYFQRLGMGLKSSRFITGNQNMT